MLDVDVLGQLRPDEHRRERRVAPRRLVERRDAHEPMHAGLGGHQPVRVIAGQRQRDALEPGFVAGLVVDDFALEAAALRPLQVHAQEHLGPVLRLGAARAGMNGDDGVGAIVLAAKHLLGLGGVDLLLKLVEAALEIGADVLAGVRPFDQHAEIVGAPPQRLPQRLVVFQAPAALHHLLRVGLVVPEVGFADALLDARRALRRGGRPQRCLRSSAARRPRSSYRRTRSSSSTATRFSHEPV